MTAHRQALAARKAVIKAARADAAEKAAAGHLRRIQGRLFKRWRAQRAGKGASESDANRRRS